MAKLEQELIQPEETGPPEKDNLSMILENHPHGVVLINRAGDWIYSNPKFTEITGYALQDILTGRSWFHLAYPDPKYRNFVKEKWKQDCVQVGAGQKFEFSITCKDGSGKWIEFVTTYLADQSIMVLTDVTSRKKDQEALQNIERKVNAIFQTVGVGIGVINLEGHFVQVNSSLTAMHGYSAEELSNKSILELTHPDDIALSIQCMQELMSGKDSKHLQKRFIHKDGSVWWGDISSTSLKNVNGEVDEIVTVVTDITERKQADEALQESEKRFRNIIENISNIAIQGYDERRNVTFWNQASEMLYGYTEQEALGKKIEDLVIPSSMKEKVIKGIKRWLEDGEQISAGEVNLIDKHGNEIPVFSSHTMQDTVQGKEMFCVDVDLAPLKQAEVALRASQERIRAIFNAVSDSIFLHPLLEEGFAPFEDVNRTACERYGYTREELLSLNVTDITLEKDAKSHGTREHRKKLHDAGQLIFETTHITKSGESFPVEIHSVIIELNGRDMILAAVRDITERKSVELALRESEKKYRILADNVEDVIFILGLDLKHTYVSPSVFNNRGFHDKEVLEHSIEETLTPDSLALGYKVISGELEAEKVAGIDPNRSKIIELEMKCKDGSTVWNEVQVSFLRDDGGKPIGILGVSRDISQRKRVEKEKAKLQAQLQQARKMEAIGTLAGGIAHDFNNLLQVITGYTEILLFNKTDDSQYFKELREIEKAGNSASDLIRELMFFSRKAKTIRKPIQIWQEVEQARKLLERTIPKMVKIVILQGECLFATNADPVQIEQILLNLGKNAADAMPEGGKLTIEIANVTLNEENAHNLFDAKPGNYILVTVSDTGVGMEKETVEHVFEPFYTTKGIGKGTGLGLASVYGIVKSHGGYVICDSEVNQGTTFRMYLPAVDVAENDAKEAVARPIQFGMETILVVDDEEPIRELTSKTLREFGYTTMRAQSGEKALDIYSKKINQIDLVLLDIGMPGMGGHRCVQELFKIDSNVKIIIASGYSVAGEIKKTLEGGASGYIAKPYSINDLLDKVRTVLDGSPGKKVHKG